MLGIASFVSCRGIDLLLLFGMLIKYNEQNNQQGGGIITSHNKLPLPHMTKGDTAATNGLVGERR